MWCVCQFVARSAALLRRGSDDQEAAAEISAHLDMAIEENLRAGMSPDEACRRALLQFGGSQQASENQRESRESSHD
jgi:putative ABC transport system permease protein